MIVAAAVGTGEPMIRLVPLTLAGLRLALSDRAGLAALVGASVPDAWPSADFRSLLEAILPEWELYGGDDGWTWLIVAEGQVVGEVGAKGGPDPAGAIEIGYGLIPAARGRGWMTEAVEQFVALAFARGVRRVLAETAPENTASHSVLRRTGFSRCGTSATGYLWERRADFASELALTDRWPD